MKRDPPQQATLTEAMKPKTPRVPSPPSDPPSPTVSAFGTVEPTLVPSSSQNPEQLKRKREPDSPIKSEGIYSLLFTVVSERFV